MAALAYAAAEMKINPKDYVTSKDRLVALNNLWEFGRGLKVYLNRVLFGLDRDCDRRDYFIGTQIYQDESSNVLEDGFNGFGAYDDDMPNPTYRLSIDGTRTVGIVEATGSNMYSPGTTINISITDDSGSDAEWSTGAIVQISGYMNAEFTGTPVLTSTFTLTDNAASGTITVPDNISGPLYLDAFGSSGQPYNEVTISSAVGDTDTTIEDLISNVDTVIDYYDPDNGTADITVTFTPLSGITLSDYNATITVREKNTLNYFQPQTAATMPSSLTFQLDDLSLYTAQYQFSNPIEVLVLVVN